MDIRETHDGSHAVQQDLPDNVPAPFYAYLGHYESNNASLRINPCLCVLESTPRDLR